jgi:hypothetical protein
MNRIITNKRFCFSKTFHIECKGRERKRGITERKRSELKKIHQKKEAVFYTKFEQKRVNQSKNQFKNEMKSNDLGKRSAFLTKAL